MTREAVSKEAKWFIGIVLIVALPVVGFLWKQSVETAKAQTSFAAMKVSLDKLTVTVEQHVKQEMADVKARLLAMEQKTILPGAATRLDGLEHRLRSVETEMARQGVPKGGS